MTRLEAFRALYAAVKDGTLPEAVFHGTSSIRNHWAYDLLFGTEQRKQVFLAYRGSVDAALALVEATLPGWLVLEISQDSRSLWYVVLVEHPGLGMSRANHDNPARALLLAIIAALIAEEDKP